MHVSTATFDVPVLHRRDVGTRLTGSMSAGGEVLSFSLLHGMISLSPRAIASAGKKSIRSVSSGETAPSRKAGSTAGVIGLQKTVATISIDNGYTEDVYHALDVVSVIKGLSGEGRQQFCCGVAQR